jgi:hypothetical protein
LVLLIRTNIPAAQLGTASSLYPPRATSCRVITAMHRFTYRDRRAEQAVIPGFPLFPFPKLPRCSVGSHMHSTVASACVRSHTMPCTFPIKLPNSPVLSAICMARDGLRFTSAGHMRPLQPEPRLSLVISNGKAAPWLVGGCLAFRCASSQLRCPLQRDYPGSEGMRTKGSNKTGCPS